jgi:hypothetical protein
VGRLYPSGERFTREGSLFAKSWRRESAISGDNSQAKDCDPEAALLAIHHRAHPCRQVCASARQNPGPTPRCCGHVGLDKEFSCPTMHTARRMQAPRFIETRRSIMGRDAYLAGQGNGLLFAEGGLGCRLAVPANESRYLCTIILSATTGFNREA